MSARDVMRKIIGIELDETSQFGYPARQRTLDVSHNVILYLDDITVSFDGFKALNKLNLMIDAGELRCIIGPNGAGKTTMMDVITGKTRPDSGTAFFGQTIDLTKLSEPQIAHTGIGRKFQKPTIFEQHSVFENLELAMTTDKRALTTLTAWLRDDDRDRIADTLRLIRLDGEADRPAGLLSHGQQQQLAIGRALAMDPKLLILDEPTEGIQPSIIKDIGHAIRTVARRNATTETSRSIEERQEVQNAIRKVADTGQVAILLVEQYYDFARDLADHYLLMERGEFIMRGLGADMDKDGVREALAV